MGSRGCQVEKGGWLVGSIWLEKEQKLASEEKEGVELDGEREVQRSRKGCCLRRTVRWSWRGSWAVEGGLGRRGLLSFLR